MIAQTNLQLERQLVAAGWSDADLLRVAAAHELAVRLFAGGVRSSGKPLLCHLVGTASQVARHDGPPALVAAALVHAAYSHGRFGDGRPAGRTPRRADLVRAHVGPESERVVARYHEVVVSDEYLADLEARREPVLPDELQLLRLLVANHTDDLLDGGIAVLGDDVPSRYRPAAVARLARVARDAGLPGMAADLEAVARVGPGDVPPPFRRDGPKGTTWPAERSDRPARVPWGSVAPAGAATPFRGARAALTRISARVTRSSRLRRSPESRADSPPGS